MNASFEALQVIDYVISCINAPNINIRLCNDLLDSDYQKIKNWEDYVVSLAVQMSGDDTTSGVGFSQVCFSIHVESI